MLDLSALCDEELTNRLSSLVSVERRCVGHLIAHLGEFDVRRLHEGKGFPTLFHYCTKVLGYSEDAAGRRIIAARKARKFPSIIGKLQRGDLTLMAVVKLARHLTSENHRRLLDDARGRSLREIDKLVAPLAPQPEPREVVRHLSVLEPPETPCVGAGQQELPVSPIESTVIEKTSSPAAGLDMKTASPPHETSSSGAPSRVRFSFTGTEALLLKVERARQLLRHKYPLGHLEDIFGDALEVLLDRKDPDRRLRRRASLRRTPPPSCAVEESRRVPQRVRDEVWERDAGQCAFRAKDGTRCAEKGGLEFDHIVPWALGGPSHDPKNIRLLCRAHNQMAARRLFGEAATRWTQRGGGTPSGGS